MHSEVMSQVVACKAGFVSYAQGGHIGLTRCWHSNSVYVGEIMAVAARFAPLVGYLDSVSLFDS